MKILVHYLILISRLTKNQYAVVYFYEKNKFLLRYQFIHKYICQGKRNLLASLFDFINIFYKQGPHGPHKLFQLSEIT